MDSNTFKLLICEVRTFLELPCGQNNRIKRMIINAKICRFIDIYRGQINHHKGLIGFRGFGNVSYRELDEILGRLGLPSLRNSTLVISEFDHLCSSPVELTNLIGQSILQIEQRFLLKLVLENVFKTLNLKRNPEVLAEVIRITWS